MNTNDDIAVGYDRRNCGAGSTVMAEFIELIL